MSNVSSFHSQNLKVALPETMAAELGKRKKCRNASVFSKNMLLFKQVRHVEVKLSGWCILGLVCNDMLLRL